MLKKPFDALLDPFDEHPSRDGTEVRTDDRVDDGPAGVVGMHEQESLHVRFVVAIQACRVVEEQSAGVQPLLGLVGHGLILYDLRV
ncbi:hypothetical protein ABTX15_22500 [Micromonospora sp. NPDC094482]|uniref:hypothetical protein n=1 Tax=unclassified Micromonospora TaxID=2617518 RepID=UPI00332768EB